MIPAAMRGLHRAVNLRDADQERQAREHEDYQIKCGQVAEAKAAGASFRMIAELQGTSVSTAERRWRAWHLQTHNRQTTEILRSAMSERYERMFVILMEEIDVVRSANEAEMAYLARVAQEDQDEVAEIPTALRVVKAGESAEEETGEAPSPFATRMSVRARGYLIAALVRQMTEVSRRHAQVLGIQTESGTQINIGPGAGSSVVALTKIEAPDDRDGQERLAAHLRGIRDISQCVDGSSS